MPQAEANVVSQNLLVSTSRKEISWCNKARLRGASTSRARAKVWCVNFKAPSQGLGPAPRSWVWGLGRAWAGASRGLGPGPQGLGARAPGPRLAVLSPGRGLAKGWESAETAAADVGAWEGSGRDKGRGFSPSPLLKP